MTCNCGKGKSTAVSYRRFETAVSGGELVYVGAQENVRIVTPEKDVLVKVGKVVRLREHSADSLINDHGAPLWILYS